MLGLLRLIRIRTLAFAILTMYAMRYMVVRPILDSYGLALQMSGLTFALLVTAICCLISAAYVINDYFDVKSDRISGVRDVVVGKSISRQSAIILHSNLNGLAVGISVVLGFILGEWQIGIAFLIVSGILWFYSFRFKKCFLVGNILVGLLSALIPLSVVAYEIPLLVKTNVIICRICGADVSVMYWVLGFSWFVFLNTLMYEINKDIFSIEGDKENGINTIPVRAGVSAARHTITALAVSAITSLMIIYFAELSSDKLLTVYLAGAVLLPYALYIWAVNFQPANRRLQLNLIRLLSVTCIGASLFLPCIFN